MTAAIEIYTRPGCGYCTAAKSLLTRKNAAFTELNVANDPALSRADVPACRRGLDVPADLHRPNPCRRLRRALCARPRRQARRAAGERKAQAHEHRQHLHRRHGADAHRAVARAEPRAGHQADPRGQGARRGLRAHPRGEQHDAVEPQGAVRASGDRRRRQVAEGLSRAGEGTEDPSSHRLAGAEVFAGEGGQPLVPDRARRRRARELRQDPYVRYRSARRRELSRIGQLPAGRDRRDLRPALGPHRAHHLLRRAFPGALPRAGRKRRVVPHRAVGLHDARPAKRIGTCCCAPARSRPAASCSPRRRPACTRTSARPLGIR